MDDSPSQQLPKALLELFYTHDGIITRQQALAAQLPAHWLTYYARGGAITPVQRGVYRLSTSEGFTNESLLMVALRVPKGVICTLSALAFHELGTVVPSAVHLAIPLNARRPRLEYPPLELYYFSNKPFQYGIETHTVGSGEVRVYSREKTLADALRLPRRVERSVFLEALKSYLSLRDRNINRLLEAAQVCRVELEMRQLTEAVLA